MGDIGMFRRMPWGALLAFWLVAVSCVPKTSGSELKQSDHEDPAHVGKLDQWWHSPCGVMSNKICVMRQMIWRWNQSPYGRWRHVLSYFHHGSDGIPQPFSVTQPKVTSPQWELSEEGASGEIIIPAATELEVRFGTKGVSITFHGLHEMGSSAFKVPAIGKKLSGSEFITSYFEYPSEILPKVMLGESFRFTAKESDHSASGDLDPRFVGDDPSPRYQALIGLTVSESPGPTRYDYRAIFFRPGDDPSWLNNVVAFAEGKAQVRLAKCGGRTLWSLCLLKKLQLKGAADKMAYDSSAITTYPHGVFLGHEDADDIDVVFKHGKVYFHFGGKNSAVSFLERKSVFGTKFYETEEDKQVESRVISFDYPKEVDQMISQNKPVVFRASGVENQEYGLELKLRGYDKKVVPGAGKRCEYRGFLFAGDNPMDVVAYLKGWGSCCEKHHHRSLCHTRK